jgi:predicted nucleic acid-binding protein
MSQPVSTSNALRQGRCKATSRSSPSRKVQHLLALFTLIDLDYAIAWRGGEIRRHYQTRLADALIAATALIHNLRLATRNLQHFTPIEGLQVEKPYD